VGGKTKIYRNSFETIFTTEGGYLMDKINEFLDLIDEFKGPINSEIKDDDRAEQVWSLINDLENKLEEVKNENK